MTAQEHLTGVKMVLRMRSTDLYFHFIVIPIPSSTVLIYSHTKFQFLDFLFTRILTVKVVTNLDVVTHPWKISRNCIVHVNHGAFMAKTLQWWDM